MERSKTRWLRFQVAIVAVNAICLALAIAAFVLSRDAWGHAMTALMALAYGFLTYVDVRKYFYYRERWGR